MQHPVHNYEPCRTTGAQLGSGAQSPDERESSFMHSQLPYLLVARISHNFCEYWTSQLVPFLAAEAGTFLAADPRCVQTD